VGVSKFSGLLGCIYFLNGSEMAVTALALQKARDTQA
jgi:hypothetical protein